MPTRLSLTMFASRGAGTAACRHVKMGRDSALRGSAVQGNKKTFLLSAPRPTPTAARAVMPYSTLQGPRLFFHHCEDMEWTVRREGSTYLC